MNALAHRAATAALDNRARYRSSRTTFHRSLLDTAPHFLPVGGAFAMGIALALRYQATRS